MTTHDMEFGTEAACAEYLLAQIPAQTLSAGGAIRARKRARHPVQSA